MKIAGIISLVLALPFADLSREYDWAIPMLIGSLIIACITFWVDYRENLVQLLWEVTVDIDEKIRAAIDRSRADKAIEINYVGLSAYLWEALGKRQGYDDVIEKMFFK